MKKFILSMLVMITGVISANAQMAYEEAKLLDNTYIGVNAGVSTPLDFNSMFPVNANFGLKVGKEFTPIFGAEIEGNTWLGQNHFANSYTAFKAINLGANGTVNLTNLFNGFNGSPRKFEVGAVAGLGWLTILNGIDLTNKTLPTGNDNDELTAKTGLNFMFNLGANKAHQIVVQPAVLWNLTTGPGDAVRFYKHGAQLSLSVGYVYKFKTSNGTHSFRKYDIGQYESTIARLKEQLSVKPMVEEKVVERIVEKQVATMAEWTVNFEQNSAVLLGDAKATLDEIGNESIVNIIATASPEGGEEYNKGLSQRRADAVAEYLANRGVRVESAKGLGVTGPNSQRIAKVFIK